MRESFGRKSDEQAREAIAEILAPRSATRVST